MKSRPELIEALCGTLVNECIVFFESGSASGAPDYEYQEPIDSVIMSALLHALAFGLCESGFSDKDAIKKINDLLPEALAIQRATCREMDEDENNHRPGLH